MTAPADPPPTTITSYRSDGLAASLIDATSLVVSHPAGSDL